MSSGNVRETEVGYAVATGERVTATLVQPSGSVAGGVLVAHGGSDDGRRFFLAEARELAAAGMAVLLPATRLPPHGDIAATEAGLHLAVAGFRGGLDLLGEHAARLCFFGHSAGAVLGSLLAGADDRLDGVVLAGMGSGTIVRLARAELLRNGLRDVEAYLAFLDRFDPRHHLARHAGRLLVQHGRHDTTVTAEESRRLHASAGPPAVLRFYDHDHSLDCASARRDRARFLVRRETP